MLCNCEYFSWTKPTKDEEITWVALIVYNAVALHSASKKERKMRIMPNIIN